ncbi:hypothetical protein Xedl_03802 [Xenorhabdus eapokensis]|uniref:Uncharacterized protein n=1 Tax=Xenorhabdus eapokensis TaxID=1873482 RepID=A0A1Q5TEY6_9GAMM|nr:hypothetical protein Xedl_03802 [Xenorhabdus eapokensis]
MSKVNKSIKIENMLIIDIAKSYQYDIISKPKMTRHKMRWATA